MKKAKKNTTLAMHITRIILIVTLQITASVAFGGTDFTVVDSGDDYSIGLKSDGTLWAWGFNFYGQLGNGTDTNTPVQIVAATNEADDSLCFPVKTINSSVAVICL